MHFQKLPEMLMLIRGTTFGVMAVSILVNSTRLRLAKVKCNDAMMSQMYKWVSRQKCCHQNSNCCNVQGYMWGNGKKTWPTGRSYDGEWRKDPMKTHLVARDG